MPSFWSDLARTLRRSAPLLLLVSVLLAMMAKLQVDDQTFAISYLLLLPVSYYLFRAALFDEGFLGPTSPTSAELRPPKQSLVRYLLVSVPVILLSVGVAIAVSVVVFFVLQRSISQVVLRFMLWFGTWIVLMAFGHLLPAAAAGQPISPRTALRVARKTVARTALPLLFLPLVTYWSGMLLGRLVGDFLRFIYLHEAARFVVVVLFWALPLISLAIVVVILTRAYRRASPEATSMSEVFN